MSVTAIVSVHLVHCTQSDHTCVTWSRGMSRMSQILFFAKRSNYFVLIVISPDIVHNAHNSETRHTILMEFVSKYSNFMLLESGVKNSKLKIFDLPLISLDHVTSFRLKEVINMWTQLEEVLSFIICYEISNKSIVIPLRIFLEYTSLHLVRKNHSELVVKLSVYSFFYKTCFWAHTLRI